MPKRLTVPLFLLYGTFVAIPATAQVGAGIYGTVTDETRSALSGVTVTVTHTQTNERRSTTTNAAGAYSLPQLSLGTYSVRAELTGFKAVTQDGVQLSLNRNARVDFVLVVGRVVEEITVVSDAPLVEATTNEMGTVVDGRRVSELPLSSVNGRNTLGLMGLVPGAQLTREFGQNLQGFVENKVAINGVRQEDSNYLLDGGDNTSTLRNYGNDVPNPDAIQEFRIITNNYSAEYGRSAGAIVNVVTKSGTNELHGSLFEFHRDDGLNATNFFQSSKSKLQQNQYGGTVGGPVIRDKTFFFVTYQGYRRDSERFTNGALVPTEAERAGDFSRSVSRTGSPIVVKDPTTGQPFPNNVIPRDRLNPVAVSYLSKFVPLPNDPSRGPNALQENKPLKSDNDQVMVKLDHTFSRRHKLSVAYFYSDGAIGQRTSEVDFVRRDIANTQQNVNLHEYWTISANVLNHFRATYARAAGDRHVYPDDLTLNDLGGKFSPLPDGPTMAPSIRVTGYFNNFSVFGGPKTANHYNVADTVDWIHDKHQLKFGGEVYLRRLFDVSVAPAEGGEFTFDGTATGNGMADFLLGRPSLISIADQSYKSQSGWAFHAFAQDKWFVTSRLVLDLGVRYELTLPPVHPNDFAKAYVPGRRSACVPQAPSGVLFACDEGIPRAGIKTDTNDVAPRLGFAYDITGDGKTVVRGGYGKSFAFAIFNALQDQQTGIPYGFVQDLRPTANAPLSLSDPFATIGGSPFPIRRDPAHLVFPATGNYAFADLDYQNGYFHQFNLSLQRQFGKNWSVDAAYVGNRGRGLLGQRDLNAPARTADASATNVNARRPLNPPFLVLQLDGGFTNSWYDAAQVKVERRFARGLSLLSSYTFGKAVDFSTWYNDRTFWADQNDLARNKGRGDQDRRHMLVVSGVWELPLFKDAKGAAGSLLGGWSLNWIGTFQSGLPVNIVTDRDADFDGNAGGDRPDLVGDWRLPATSPSEAKAGKPWFDPAAFTANKPGRVGSFGRNVITGPGYKNIDLGVSKAFRINDHHKAQVRVEVFNVLNWVNLGTPENRLSRATFGQISSTLGDARAFQLGVRYVF
jgi:hypothetical protein